MIHEHVTMRDHGFVGHLAEPDGGSDRAVLVIAGGEQGILPGIKIAERFADYGLTGLAVSLFGAEGLPDSPDRCPVEMFGCAVDYLRNRKHVHHISAYGMSMGSIFAALVAVYVGGIENVIMVSPTHVPFEGTTRDKRHMTGHSVATWRGRDVPFVTADFTKVKASRYQSHPAAAHRVMGMWAAYYDAYQDTTREQQALLPIERTGARVLLVAGGADEAWPAEYSVRTLREHLGRAGYRHDVKTVVYPNASHLLGMMPNRERERRLYRLMPLIGVMYRSFGKHRKECLEALAKSEREIITWLS